MFYFWSVCILISFSSCLNVSENCFVMFQMICFYLTIFWFLWNLSQNVLLSFKCLVSFKCIYFQFLYLFFKLQRNTCDSRMMKFRHTVSLQIYEWSYEVYKQKNFKKSISLDTKDIEPTLPRMINHISLTPPIA